MFWAKEDHRLHQPNYYNNFQIVQHQNGIPQAPAAMPPQQQQHPTPPPQLQQHPHQHQQQQQQQQQPQQPSTHRSAQQIPSHYAANQQMQHHQQWAARPPPILTTPPFFQQFPTTLPSSTQYCAAQAQYFHPQRVSQPASAVPAATQQRPILPPGCAMYPTLRQNVLSQPSAAIMTPTTSSAAQQIQVQYFSPAQYCQPPIVQPTYGHVIAPAIPDAPVVKHRKHAIPIIDPMTQENILERELRKSESASPALSIAATTSSTSNDLKESDNSVQEEHPNTEEEHIQHQQQEYLHLKEQHLQQQRQLEQNQDEHRQMETPPITIEKEEIGQDVETEQVEQEEPVTESDSVVDSQITSQLDHVDSIEVEEEEVGSTVTDEETQATDITPTATRSATPISSTSVVTTPPEGINETKVESPQCGIDDTDTDTITTTTTDKEPASVTEKNPPGTIVKEVAEEKKPPVSNQKQSTAAAQTQQNTTKSNKQSRKQQQQQPPTSSKTSSKKNKKNKRAKELQKKQQKTLMLNVENNNNTIKQTTSQTEAKNKQELPSLPSKQEETASTATENASVAESVDGTDGIERDSESPSNTEAEAPSIDQDTQSINSSQLMKYLDSNEDNGLLFLNSSMSGYEDEVSVQDTPSTDKTNDIVFGSFSQENSTQEISVQDDDVSIDEIDDDDSLTNPKEGKKLVYTMQQLKKLADKPNSKIPPTIRGEIGDIIAKNSRDGGVASSQTGNYQQNQMFQQLSYKDSMNYVSRKRNKQQYHHQQYEQMMQQQHQRNPDIIRINLSLNEEIKLSKSDNAWVPAGLQITNPKAEAENDEQMLKKIRGILNKLTPENFSKLLQSASDFPISGEERIKKVMLLIFEKTVSEPNFAPTYARFCKFLFNQQNKDNLIFKANLIKRIREEFDSNVNNAKAKNAKLQPLMEKLAAATDPKEKLEIKAELDDQEYQFRRRAWGTVRFIGEMCKLGFIGTDRVCTCIEHLLDPQCEEKLEYMCKLLTTVGAQLEPADNKQQAASAAERVKIAARLDAIFKSISRLLSEKKKGIGPKISSRVRFMMQDVLELRARGWDQKPVSNLNSREMSPAFMPRGQSQNAGKLGGGSNYMTPGVYDKRRPGDSQKTASQVNIDVNKLLPLFNKDESTITLGSSSLMMWKTVGRPQQQLQRPQSPPKPQQNNRQQSGSLVSESKESSPSSQQVELTNDECKSLLNKLIAVTIEQEDDKYWFEKWKEIPPAHHSTLIYYLLAEHIHSKYMNSPPQADACRRLFTILMKETLLTRHSFSEGYRKFSLICDDLLVDVPKCFQYVFNLLSPLLYHKLIPFDLVWSSHWYNSFISDKFLHSMIVQFTSEFGANYMRFFWESNKLRWDLFVSPSKVRDFVEKNCFEFVENRKRSAPIFVKRSAEELVQRIKALLEQSDQDIDLIIDFISTNVNIDSDFINNLTMFLCDYTVIYCNTPDSSSISSNSSKTNKLSDSHSSASASLSTAPYRLRRELFVAKCIPLLRWCTDCTEDREFACLDAIVKKCNQLCESSAEGLISSILMELYVEEVISKDSLEKWKKLRAEKNNKLANELDAIFKKLQF